MQTQANCSDKESQAKTNQQGYDTYCIKHWEVTNTAHFPEPKYDQPL